jgi:HlyD family secretion protein
LRARYWFPLVLLAALGAGAWKLLEWRNQPPEVSFARAARETITSSVSTNGKAEPIEWAIARAARSGPVTHILIARGQTVAQDQALAEIDTADSRAELAGAEARTQGVQAELDVLNKGGRAAELTEFSSALDRARLDLSHAQREYDTLLRLQAKQAATKSEVDAAKQPIDQAQLQIKSLEQKRTALVVASDRTAVEARLRDLAVSSGLAAARIRQGTVRSPLAGVAYQFDLKPGAYLNAGDAVATIGRLERIHVNVYVDEPDLGRVRRGLPVLITWDALPGRQWKGIVERTAVQIVTLGARQVGEVVCTIENPDRDLLPGTNVTAEILSETADNVVTIPKETLRREGGKDGVYVLDGDRLAWRAVTIGVNNTTRAQVSELKEGDALALPTELVLKDGLVVRAVFP